MNPRIENVLKKEMKEIFSSRSSALLVTVLPFFLTVYLIVIFYVVFRYFPDSIASNPFTANLLIELERINPSIKTLETTEIVKLLAYSVFPAYLLLIPTLVSNSFATFGIIEEKQTKTLEPLLATPVSVSELLIGKILAGTIPAILMTWACFGVAVIGIAIIGPDDILRYAVTYQWFVSIFVLTPLVTIAGYTIGIMGSSVAKDVKGAQNFSIFIVLPILALVAGEIMAISYFLWIEIASCVALFIADFFLLRLSVKIFDREAILTKWK